MRALSHSDTDHCVEVEQEEWQFPSKPPRKNKRESDKKSPVLCVSNNLIHKEVPAPLMLNLHSQNHRCYHYGRVLTVIVM